MRNRQHVLVRGLVVLLLAAVVAGPVPAAQAQTRLVMAFVPSLDAERVLASGRTVARMLEVATGYSIEATVPTSYAATIEALCAGRVHIAWFAPASYVLANARCGAEVGLISIRANLPYYGSQILVRSDVPARSIADLRGKRFAFGDPASTSSYIWPAVYIKKKGFDPNTFFSQVIFAGGHDRVVIAIYQGSVDAGATFGDRFGSDARERVMRQFPDVKEKVRILEYVGPPTIGYIPNDTISFRKELPDEVKQRIIRAMFHIAQTPPGREAVNALYQHEGYATYEDLIKKYNVDPRQVPNLDAFFNPIRDAIKLLGLDLNRIVR
ncbi:MAG: phosphate/phosphite/phosphonate ABC transporter substrate-binding protein [Armatimonadota bacterium]|nr:phosphate/phosphite/phosphonate ABC transporter substrate-binding protein [Armatimonadota bacterium]MDR7489465.1 phosphate/phosphite/phosphonate ABC transporter substrate-binding protein [Armatimonadota bacterium]MDR7490696.1 phosphate/phosphite/phosphonate ABC transporter substrate-binding protein [Armatimonadota bacterium]MDR7502062.1 phosphate/phosphite/phosphonate ABC transporter substrate-binding protein [Armatimonadota bacterium]MDR7528987.1 phosphate/phosphite/phosphonate ABC transpor